MPMEKNQINTLKKEIDKINPGKILLIAEGE